MAKEPDLNYWYSVSICATQVLLLLWLGNTKGIQPVKLCSNYQRLSFGNPA